MDNIRTDGARLDQDIGRRDRVECRIFADEAIETGQETITKTLMDTIVLGQRAEARHARTRHQRAKATKPTTPPAIAS